MSLSLRTLFDTMLGNYSKQSLSRNDETHTILIMIHLIISNVFLLNYLVAILSSAYEYMKDFGEFDFKATRYAYVERYQKAFLNKQGYAELVIQPAPLNILNIILIPFAFVPDSFQSKAEVFSKLMFWFENLFFLILLLVYSILLVPLIFFKMLYNFFRSMKLLTFLIFSIVWVIIGFLALPFYVIRDMAYLTIIFCSYNDENDQSKEKEFEDHKQDKIMIYNEIIDVMKASLHYAKIHRRLNRGQEYIDGYGAIEEDRYVLDKRLIFEAWKRYRPSENNLDAPNEHLTGHNSNKNFKTVVGQHFINRLIENINKNSQQVEVDEDEILSASDTEIENSVMNEDIPLLELEITDEFLNRFLLASDTFDKEAINLELALRALPKRVNEHNESKISLINFTTIQISLIGFQNDDKDELFNFYDKRSFKRIYKLRKNCKENSRYIEDLHKMSERMILKVKSMFDIVVRRPEPLRDTGYGPHVFKFDKSESDD